MLQNVPIDQKEKETRLWTNSKYHEKKIVFQLHFVKFYGFFSASCIPLSYSCGFLNVIFQVQEHHEKCIYLKHLESGNGPLAS